MTPFKSRAAHVRRLSKAALCDLNSAVLVDLLPLFGAWHRSCSIYLPEDGVETMREKSEFRPRAQEPLGVDPEQVRSDLEQRGIDPEFSRPVAERLVAVAMDLSADEYAAILDGVSAAYGVHREISEPHDADLRQANELHRLIDGFTGELRKFDEGLRMLSAYLVRMGSLVSRESSGPLH